MKTYSVLIAWDDEDPHQGNYGVTVRAENPEQAEHLVREQMRDVEGVDQAPDGETFGGSVHELHEGDVWRAMELEDALRALLDTAFCSVCHAGKRKAIVAARKLLADIEAGT